MKIWTDREGNRVGVKEFFKRFGEGLEGITALQQTENQLRGMLPIFAGMLWGFVVCWFGKYYWMCLILFGSFIVSFYSTIGIYQKYKILKHIEQLKGGREHE